MATKNSLPSLGKGKRNEGKVSHEGKGKKVTEEKKETGWTADDDSDSEIEDDWCFVSLYGTVENESETEEEENTVQIAQEVANIISKELLYNQEDELSAETIDEIFRTFEEVAEVDSRPMVTFLAARKHPKPAKEDDDDRPMSSITDKSIMIALMVDLLRVSPEPEEIHLLWLRILTHFVLLTNDLQTLLDLKVAPTILGTMSAYRGSAEIQHFGCIALTVFAGTRPTPSSKAPLRDSAVQVLTQSLVNHTDNVDVVQAACLLISKVAEVMVSIPSWCMEQEFSAEETEKLCQSADNTLQCIKDGVIDRLEAISTRYSDMEEIKASIAKLMACFGCYSSDRRFPESSEANFRPKAFTYPVSPKAKHVTFSHELEVILADSEENDGNDTKRCLSLDGTKMPHGGNKSEFRNRTIDQPEDVTESVYKDTEENVRDEEMSLEVETGQLKEDETSLEVERGQLKEDEVTDSDCKLDERKDVSDSDSNDVTGCDEDRLLSDKLEIQATHIEPLSHVLSEDSLGRQDYKLGDSFDDRSDGEIKLDNQGDSDGVALVSFKQGDLYLSDKSLPAQRVPKNGLETSPNGSAINDGSLGDIADEMSDGVYSYSVQETSKSYVEYSEFDIVEALVKSGLLNESEKKPEIPKFPVDDTIMVEGETDINFTGKEVLKRTSSENENGNGKPLHVVESVEGEICEGFHYENSAGESSKMFSNRGKEKFQRVPSEYDNVRTRQNEDKSGQDHEEWIHEDGGERNDGRGVEGEGEHEQFKQASFDSGSHDLFLTQTEEAVDNSIMTPQEGDGGDAQESDRLGANRDRTLDDGDVQLRETSERIGEETFIDECHRMSTLSILQDDIQNVTWHENAAFRSTSSMSEDNSAAYSLTSAEYIVDHNEDASKERTGFHHHGHGDASGEHCFDATMYIPQEGEAKLTRTESNGSETSCSRSSCSSGSYCVQNGRLKEYRSMGSLDQLCSPRETQSVCELDCKKKGNRSDVLKTMSCSNVDQVVPPPKPRRTWYYQSSWDVRRSLVRSFGPDYDTISNPIYDEPPAELYATVSKPKKKYQHIEPAYAKVQKRHLSPSSSEASNGSFMHKSGTNSSNDSGVVLLANKRKTRGQSHLYEAITPLLAKDKETPDSIARYLEGDSSEATYEVCTLWVNDKCSEALETFNHLTQRLVSLYSIVPVAREEENRRSAVECDPDDLEDDYPAWANILNVLASDETKWTLRLAAQALPIVDRLFQVKDKNVLNAVIELVQVLIKRYGKDIIKNRHPSLFRTRFREDCRACFIWLGKLHLRTDFLLRKRNEAKTLDWDCLLHSSLLDSFIESLQPFTQNSLKTK
ncbi:hypothetical protein HOLleu_06814 [Holothuria leucospilota]|uniref:Uncharacterized protein n=1 Tax=Holothuria leucospilota TaxID=206669 RepID=A0A9Q1CLY6_HOLLE|nr:hypothetical protein HOLleu_06814 [Holothuria leucospilota]